jgi:hypothetical protein
MKTTFLMLTIISILIVAGCTKDTLTGSLPSTPRYPFAAGNEWHYTRTLSTFNFRPIRTGATFRDTSVVTWYDVKVIGRDTLRDSIPTWKLQSTFSDSINPSRTGYTFYRELADTVILIAYNSDGFATPKQISSVRIHFAGKIFNSLPELFQKIEYVELSGMISSTRSDSLTFEARPVRSLVYPLDVGKEWTYREIGSPWYMKKKVVGAEWFTISRMFTPSVNIQWFWDMNNDSVIDTTITGNEYIGTEGLLGRTFIFKNFAVFGDDPTPIGYFDVKDELKIRSLSIHSY